MKLIGTFDFLAEMPVESRKRLEREIRAVEDEQAKRIHADALKAIDALNKRDSHKVTTQPTLFAGVTK